MKKSKKNRYAGSQPEERYGLGTRKSLYLDRPTSHGGWPEGEYDPPINDRIYDYLKSMGLVQETHLRQMIRGILNEAEPSDEFNASTPRSSALGGVKVEENPLATIVLHAPIFFGVSVGKVWLNFTNQLISGQLEEKTIMFIGNTFPNMVNAFILKGNTKDDAERKVADIAIRSGVKELHDILSLWGVVFDPADLLDGLIYFFEKKYKAAALSLLCAIPAVGSAIKSKSLKEFTTLRPHVPLIVGGIGSFIDKIGLLKLEGVLDKKLSDEINLLVNALIDLGADSVKLGKFLEELNAELNSPVAKMHKENSKRILDNIERIATA